MCEVPPACEGMCECGGFSEYLWVHVLPSAYFHVCFYFNWYMCVFGSRPSDVLGGCVGGGLGDWRGERGLPIQTLKVAEIDTNDIEHWSAGDSLMDTMNEEEGAGWEGEGNIGNVLKNMKKHQEALVQLQQGLDVLVAVGQEHDRVVKCRKDIVNALADMGKYEEGLFEYRKKLEEVQRYGGTISRKKGRSRGPLGTDGDALRGHYCRACEAYVVRSDHHCPFLGVCVGAHNQAYFVALVLQMVLSMVYGSALIVPAALVCVSKHPGPVDKCSMLLPISFSIVFVTAILACFWALIVYLISLNLTIREAVKLDVFRFRIGPCRVWGKIRENTDVSANIASVLGASGWKGFAGLLVPRLRGAAVLLPLDLPSEEELAKEGVYWTETADGTDVMASKV
jgi:hypothetical protein